MRRTIDEIAEDLDIDRTAAEGLVAFLKAIKQIRFRGERKNPSGIGKGAHVYDIPMGAGKEVGAMLRKLEMGR